MNKKQQARLLSALSRNFQYQTPTPVLEGDKVVRYNLTMMASDYLAMMGVVTAAGGFVMPKADRDALIAEHAAKAKTAAGEYDLSTWSMGELAAAREDLAGVEERRAFRDAVSAEIKRRSS